MRITRLDTLHCDAGWRNFSFVRLTADNGLVGWSEYQEGFGSPGVTAAIEGLAHLVIDQDPRQNEKIYWSMYGATRPAAGGVIAEALGAIENALLDLKAKHYGVPCYELLGGAVRERIRVYWSHCGTYRVNWPEVHGNRTVTSLADVRELGREVKQARFTGLKTNVFLFDRQPHGWFPGFNTPADFPELNAERDVIAGLKAELEAFREGAGPDMDILLDLNFNCRTEGYIQIVQGLADLGLFWIEIDSYCPEGLAEVRRRSPTPISSCETLIGIREFRPYFEHQSMDVAIIDAMWNGIWQSMKIAALAESREINIAPHNFYGHLSTFQNAHFVAAVPNFRIMEVDVDEVPWRSELFTHVPQIEDGYLSVPSTPGWGTEPKEDALKAHPPKHVGGFLGRQRG